jgi:hypothetical protein
MWTVTAVAAEDARSRTAREAEALARSYAEGLLTADEYYAGMERLAEEAIAEELDEAAERRHEAAERELATAAG